MKIVAAVSLSLTLALVGACGPCCLTDDAPAETAAAASVTNAVDAGETAAATKADTAPLAAGVYVVAVKGMTCMEGCGTRVTTALKKLDQVQDVKIDLEAQTATVTVAAGVSEEDVRHALEALPYEFGGVTRAGA